MPRFILCLCGGGIKGVVLSTMLKCIRKEFGISVADFDLVVGTSVGALVATAYGLQLGTEDDLFSVKNVESIFDKSLIDIVMKEVQFSPMYDGLGKRLIIESMVNRMNMKHVQPLKLAIPLFNLSERKPLMICSYRPEHSELNLADILDAASSPPIYFPPVKIPALNHSWCADGGIFCNNPVMAGLHEARCLFPNSDLRILVLGTGKYPKWKLEEVVHWGAIQYLQNGLFDVLLEAQAEYDLKICMDVIGDEKRLLHLNPQLETSIELDDANQIEKLQEIGKQLFEENRFRLAEFFESFRKRKITI